MKIYLLSLMVFISCVSPDQLETEKKPLEQTTFLEPIAAERNFQTSPEVFTAFLWPEEFDWESDLFDPGMPHAEKLKCAAINVIKKNAQNDEIDKDIYKNRIIRDGYQLIVDECYEDEWTDECDELELEVIPELDDKINALTKEKEKVVNSIIASIDKDPENPSNWFVKLDNKGDSSFDLKAREYHVAISDFSLDPRISLQTEDGSITEPKYNKFTQKVDFSFSVNNKTYELSLKEGVDINSTATDCEFKTSENEQGPCLIKQTGAKTYKVSLNERESFAMKVDKNPFALNFKHFGGQTTDGSAAYTYSTYDGSISLPEWDPAEQLLTFKLYEKYPSGTFTKRIYEFKLFKMAFLESMRLTGKFNEVDENGTVLRQGIAKMDFAEIKF